jgi:Fe-S cluster assembly protein SufD
MQIDNYLNTYQSILNASNGDVPEFIRKERDAAKDAIEKNGLPDRSDERYRYLDLKPVFDDTNYKHIITEPVVNDSLGSFFQCEVQGMDTDLILLSNGWYHESTLPKDSKVVVCSMREAFQKYPELVQKHFNQYLKKAKDGWTELNTMLSQDGVFIHVPDNYTPKKAIQIVNLTHGFSEKEIFQRNLIVVGKNAKLQLLFCDHTLNKAKNVNHLGTEVYIDENADFQMYDLQNEPDISNVFSHLAFHQEAYSRLTALAFSLHGGTIRNNLYVKLNGEGAESNVYGLVLSDRQQRMDNFTFIDHAVPNCVSNEFYKSILDEQSRGAFSGRILVRKDAQNTNAFQTNNNICLTDEAKMRTKPQLEIYADDVKCSHGATVGQLDEEAMFYLRARGIDKKEARFMMLFAFAYDVVGKIEIEPLRERVSDLVSKRLRGELVACEHCLLNCENN